MISDDEDEGSVYGAVSRTPSQSPRVYPNLSIDQDHTGHNTSPQAYLFSPGSNMEILPSGLPNLAANRLGLLRGTHQMARIRDRHQSAEIHAEAPSGMSYVVVSDGEYEPDNSAEVSEPEAHQLQTQVYHASGNHEVSDSDEEIAVLSKEEAERIGTFKKSCFEIAPRPLTIAPRPAMHLALAPQTHQVAPVAVQDEDRHLRNYFERFPMERLDEHQVSLSDQLQRLEASRDELLTEITAIRDRLSMLKFDQYAERTELHRNISYKLQAAESTITRAKKVRRYQGVLASVIESRRQYPTPVEWKMDQPVYSQNVNPYMSRVPDEDQVHLEKLLRDISKEETVEGMAPTPNSLAISLLDHQRRGLHWLLAREKANAGCILADDMGLGKTVQTIALMMANPPNDSKLKTTLIVGPVSLLRQWYAELKAKLKPEAQLKAVLYHGQDKRKLSTFQRMSKYDVVLTSYTTLASEFKHHFSLALEEAQNTRGQNALPAAQSGGHNYESPFFTPNAIFYRVVLDEAQFIKNKMSQLCRAVTCLKAMHRICLTGTPMQNNIDELYPILRFLKLKPYDDEKKFKQDISVPLKGNSEVFDDYDRNQSMRKLRAVLLAVMLRRTKDSQVDGKPLVQLPQKHVKLLFVTMDDSERNFYTDLEAGVQRTARRLLASSNVMHSDFLTLLLRLRQACIHQMLVEVGELNVQEKNRTTSSSDWTEMFESIMSMDELAKQTVEGILREGAFGNGDGSGIERTTNEVQVTCPFCFDSVGEDSIVVLANCGHMICDGCIELFLNQNPGLEATCQICNSLALRADLIDFGMYTKVVHDGKSYGQLESIYGSPHGVKSTNSDKVKMLIDKVGGFTPSAKIAKSLDLIMEVTSDTPDEKLIVFSHFTTTFDLMGYALRQGGISYLRYDGSMGVEEKNRTIEEFYQGDARVLLISLKAGNVGLTLTCASHVIIMDPFWNPYVEEQAMDRAHRYGQQREVNVYRLLIRESVEARILDLQERKKELIGSALDEKQLRTTSHLGRRELGFLFGLNAL